LLTQQLLNAGKDLFVLDKATGRYILAASLDRGVKIFFVGQEAIHTLLREFVRASMRLSSKMLEPLFLLWSEVDGHGQTLCGLGQWVNGLCIRCKRSNRLEASRAVACASGLSQRQR
jgi:hypothetical protein